MASWMIHFRVADALLQADVLRELPPEAQAAFITGNVAPDSGTPLPGGGYAPDKDTSHFMRRFDGVPEGQNPDRCDPFLLLDGWLLPALEDNDPLAQYHYLVTIHTGHRRGAATSSKVPDSRDPLVS